MKYERGVCERTNDIGRENICEWRARNLGDFKLFLGEFSEDFVEFIHGKFILKCFKFPLR